MYEEMDSAKYLGSNMNQSFAEKNNLIKNPVSTAPIQISDEALLSVQTEHSV